MRRILAPTLLAALAAFFFAVPPAAADPAAIVQGTGGIQALSFDRQVIVDDVVHYTFDLPVGPGDFDVIRLHRVVRERKPHVPARSRQGIFLVHGAAWGFEAAFLASRATPEVPDQQALPVFLAENGADVWGVSLRWTLVPADTTDLSFMAGWGFGTDVEDVETALAAARAVRLATGSGLSKLVLAGWSRGGQIGYAVVGAETRRPPGLRHVRAFIPIDIHFKTDDEAVRQAACDSYAAIEQQIADGAFASDFTIVAEIGDLATTAPDDPSPFFPIVSNADLAELIGADVNASGPFPALHSVGGVIDPVTLETELLYTPPALWFAHLSAVSAYQPLKIDLEGTALVCDEIDVPYDDHLADVTLPLFYVGMAGGYGEVGIYSTTLVASSDVTVLMISESPDPVTDYGHTDPLLADGAEALVWQPILDWIESR